MFHTATPDQIKKGLVTDVYFERTEQILKAKKCKKIVKMEVIAKGLPDDWKWGIFAGVEECARLLNDLPLDVRMMREGTVFHSYEPVMEISGIYLDFCRFETALLGLICQATGIATMAARCRKAAGPRPLISFGARRMHPAIGPMIDRNAFMGGCDFVSIGLGAKLTGHEPVGTMPHALVLVLGSTVEATMAFHETIDPNVGRVSLIDTFNDEKFEALNVADRLGKDLFGIRLDTPGSRRGNFLKIMEEVRWELDIRGYDHVKLYVSGGLDEYQILEYNRFADAYGVGTSISNAPVVDFSLDIVEVDGNPLAKRGKMSGSKRVYRCGRCDRTTVLPFDQRLGECPCGGRNQEILVPFLKKGKLKASLPKPDLIRKRVLKQLERLEL